MEVGWGGEGGMVGNIGLLASHLSHLTKSHRPKKIFCRSSIMLYHGSLLQQDSQYIQKVADIWGHRHRHRQRVSVTVTKVATIDGRPNVLQQVPDHLVVFHCHFVVFQCHLVVFQCRLVVFQ